MLPSAVNEKRGSVRCTKPRGSSLLESRATAGSFSYDDAQNEREK